MNKMSKLAETQESLKEKNQISKTSSYLEKQFFVLLNFIPQSFYFNF